MAIIEELSSSPPPTGLENLNLNDMVSSAVGAELPAALADVKSQTSTEFIKQLNKMPLFMTTLDDTGSDDSTPNEALEAIKALQYEGSPRDIALNFKTQGNECFKAKQYKDARTYYTKALQTDCDDADLTVDCINNRAQCNLVLGNYGKCIVDCRASLAHRPRSEKPWFRAARALLAIDKIEEARACVENAVALMKPGNRQIVELAAKVEERGKFLVAKREEEEKRRVQKQSAERDIAIALKVRGIERKRKTSSEPWAFAEEYPIGFAEKGDPRTPLVFPTVMIYYVPGMDLTRLVEARTDLVAQFNEQTSIEDQLEEVLAEPLPWDTARDFTVQKVDAYLETKTGGLVKWGKHVSLMEVMSSGKTFVADGVVVTYVVPKTMAGRFVEDWKKMKMRK